MVQTILIIAVLALSCVVVWIAASFESQAVALKRQIMLRRELDECLMLCKDLQRSVLESEPAKPEPVKVEAKKVEEKKPRKRTWSETRAAAEAAAEGGK